MPITKEQSMESLYWLQHCGSWFGFAEPARFAQHKDGGYFASASTGEPIHARVCNGYHNPGSGIAPWATDSNGEESFAQVPDFSDDFDSTKVVIHEQS